MFTIWIVFHVIICIALVVVVLLQSSKGEGLAGSAFGGGGGGGMSGAVFGGRGAASFLSKLTTIFAVVFMLNCGGLAFLSASDRVTFDSPSSTTPTESVVTREATKEREQALKLQQEQQQQQSDSALESIQILPNEAADQQTETPTQTENTGGN